MHCEICQQGSFGHINNLVDGTKCCDSCSDLVKEKLNSFGWTYNLAVESPERFKSAMVSLVHQVNDEVLSHRAR